MPKKTREVSQLADLTYTHTLFIESTDEYKDSSVSQLPTLDLYFHVSATFCTFMAINIAPPLHGTCICKSFDLTGFLRHYLWLSRYQICFLFVPTNSNSLHVNSKQKVGRCWFKVVKSVLKKSFRWSF